MTVMILKSADGQEYAHALLLSDLIDAKEAYGLVQDTLRAAKLNNPDTWTWEEDILPALEKIPTITNPTRVIDGPAWDE